MIYLWKKEEEKKEEEEKKIKEEEKPKFQFLTDNIKLLYFKEDLSKNIKPKKKEEPKIDIKKLMRYTKRGKSAKWFYPNINNTLNKKEEEKKEEEEKKIKEEERPKSNNVKFKKRKRKTRIIIRRGKSAKWFYPNINNTLNKK